MTNKLVFEICNNSDLFWKYKVRLEVLMAVCGDDARVYDLIQRSKRNG